MLSSIQKLKAMLMQVVEHSLGMPSLMLGESMEQISSNMDTRTMRQPLGVVAGIAPFNFPAMYVYIYRIYGMRLVVAVHVYAARQCLFRTDERQALQETARRTCAHRDLALLILIVEQLLDIVCVLNGRIPLWMIPIAVSTGNAIILKPSEKVPSASHRIVELATQAGLPPGAT